MNSTKVLAVFAVLEKTDPSEPRLPALGSDSLCNVQFHGSGNNPAGFRIYTAQLGIPMIRITGPRG